ncbi:DUF6247 family protein [Actinocorallia sp. A-T 12471]|uniref:DUF6247 family protein n=1 Tax=Actinocorallia sp. A-T 12471 TaxID=3089813 RepID=UPI0029CBC620|nr:DUF6247 family protein [Actinocorallia sp. A-T 12471]MDX6738501.1 DUF6247 family protein [Actinocorallia sp. A-T 12471]
MAAAFPDRAREVSDQVPDRSPRAIRAVLLPEERGDFDREYRQVMADATEDLDLAPVLEFIERWWRVAVLSRDPQRHRAALDVVARLDRGDPVPTHSALDLIKARLTTER